MLTVRPKSEPATAPDVRHGWWRQADMRRASSRFVMHGPRLDADQDKGRTDLDVLRELVIIAVEREGKYNGGWPSTRAGGRQRW